MGAVQRRGHFPPLYFSVWKAKRKNPGMLKESIVGKAIVVAKAAGLAVNPVAGGLLLGATVSVMMITNRNLENWIKGFSLASENRRHKELTNK